MKNITLLIISFIILAPSMKISARLPNIPDKDIIFQKANTGYDLYIKKNSAINCILLTESQKDPSLKKTNYGLRTPKFHPCNGNEKRILDDRVLSTKYDVFFLVDSTPEKHPTLGDAFHYFLPEKVLYGYEWSRKGELSIEPGVRINLRMFEKKYADYSGEFKDQWIILKLKYSKKKFQPHVVENFKKLTESTNGNILIKTDAHDLNNVFKDHIVKNVPVSYEAEVVFIIDATISMRDEIPYFQKQYIEIINKLKEKVKYLRIGLIFYRDYGEDFLTRVYPLTNDLASIHTLIKQIKIKGGDDIPEALNEAIYELNTLDFRSKSRIVFLVGDAPAHPNPRGKVSGDDALQTLKDLDITLNAICFPVR